MGELIPLFPLGTPLFPGVVLPLQIFEPRYRRLMQRPAGPARGRRPAVLRRGRHPAGLGGRAGRPRRGALRHRLHRPASRPCARSPTAASAIVTVGGERFRLLDVVVGDDPPYLQAEVEWLAEEEAGRGGRRATTTASSIRPGSVVPSVAAAGLDDVVASVARGSMDVLSRNVRDLFTRYVAEVAGLSAGGGRRRRAPAVDAETAVLLHAVDRRPDGAVLPGGVGGAADHRGPAGAAGRVGDPAPAGRRVTAAAPRADPAAGRSAPSRCRCSSSPHR